jgi:transposase
LPPSESGKENLLSPRTNQELFENYKGQAKVERGFRFLKDPQFMAATFFVKNPERVEALLFIMTLC